ncbi:MAG: TfoX/Sxy family protein [Oscillospiraceae bacterium]|nr:TfoX/Sxy family protein [Oscillospiraceae bacterium]
MATTKEYADYVMDLLSPLEDISIRKMMGEYLLYYNGKLFGGIYDDRFLVKITPSSSATLTSEEIPYDGAKPMLLVDTEDREFIRELVEKMYSELPQLKKKK